MHLLQFWGETFKNDADLFPNFSKMYVKAVQNGIRFPTNGKSQYSHLDKYARLTQSRERTTRCRRRLLGWLGWKLLEGWHQA